MTINKGITLPSVGLSISDIYLLNKKGINTVFLASDSMSKTTENYKKIRESKTEIVVLDIGWGTFDQDYWKQRIDAFDCPYYYMDEPYAARINYYIENRQMSKNEAKESVYKDIVFRRDYIKRKRPNSKFVIGDIREVMKKDYVPIDDVYYTYTSYTNNIYIPILDKALPFGLGNQSPAIARLYKKVNGRVPFIWVYGGNKLLCHPDEYSKLINTCKKLNIPTAVMYARDGLGSEKYSFNKVNRKQLLEYIDHFLNEETPYTILEWWKRFFYRLGLSFSELFKTWNFKKFFNKLF